ncbi:hypothetical protein V8G54_000544 [Vigna mungo]|uniref:Uncharacterized protein n=1 Tax=Vigna mungo TaxID=3915 RepID=A0AAQ3P6N6_VIGMU
MARSIFPSAHHPLMMVVKITTFGSTPYLLMEVRRASAFCDCPPRAYPFARMLYAWMSGSISAFTMLLNISSQLSISPAELHAFMMVLNVTTSGLIPNSSINASASSTPFVSLISRYPLISELKTTGFGCTPSSFILPCRNLKASVILPSLQ